eukprot:GGOE01011061.1.p1 GENE.GGOE01011061.1~~GGOE01011061.1.p1  ORF type:complete len:1225 (-),score=408.76 GGOE01011061.1:1387-4929(-)
MASTGIRSGIGLRAAFQEANDAGGVNSRNITLVALDDQGQGSLSLPNLAVLNSTYDALLIAAVYMCSSFRALLPTLVSAQIPLVGPLVGLPSTRHPFRDVVINLRPSFADEAVALARFLVEFLRVQRIACFYTNDDLGLSGHGTLVDALNSVGLRLVVSAMYAKDVAAPDMTLPMETILGAQQKPQAVVLICLEADIAQFITTFRQDSRADSNCSFIFLSVSSASSLSSSLGPQNWRNVYFSRTVPMPDADYGLSQHFTQVVDKYIPADLLTDQLTFESYIAGRFIVEVLKGISNRRLSRETFLDAVYNTRLFYLDGMPVGLYGRNFSGCEYSICSCNAGMRRVYIATLDPATGRTVSNPRFLTSSHSILECAASNNLIRRPILFGQLLPTDDPQAYNIARDLNGGIRSYFTDINAAGGLNGRQFDLVSAEYSGDPANATAALFARWPLVALLGGVVTNSMDFPNNVPRVGTFDLTPRATESVFDVNDVRAQSSTPLEMMGLAGYVVQQLQTTVHLRVRRSTTSAALLSALTKSLNTFQSIPASAAEFDSATAAFDGLSEGYVIGIGNTADFLAWMSLLEAHPGLTLLSVKPCVLLLMATGLINPNATAFNRVLFPFVTQLINSSSAQNDKSFPWKYGSQLGNVVVSVLSQSSITLSSTYTTQQDMINAWYDVQVMKLPNAMLGPYYSANCSAVVGTQCECNLGARTVTIVSASPQSPVLYRYQSPTCRVQYQPLILQDDAPSNNVLLPVVLGVVLSVACVLAIAAMLVLRRKRNNRAAPKDASQPFCIIFTDIQASTTLWATLPNDMAAALDTHHLLIRKLIRKYNCYEVKTIGDSFMCATTSPTQALRFALAVQETFHQHDWGTTAIDDAYDTLVEEVVKTPECWNGLRVRVGIHLGRGDIKRDPVSHGYDYYGTVVNVAARIESVCHGGQIAVSEAVSTALGGHLAGSVWMDLGLQVLRGLSEPLHLYQVLPEGVLAKRRFPPLRISRVDGREEALEEMEELDEMGSSQRSTSSAKAKHSVVPSNDSGLNYYIGGKWAEVHPLVQMGEITADELRHHYAILQTGLCTLLASQVKEVKAQMVKSLCDRMHVTDFGVDESLLPKTLHGLITRVLAATIVQQARRRPSRLSSSQTTPRHYAPTHTSIPNRTRQVSPAQDCAVDISRYCSGGEGAVQCPSP